MKVKVCRQSGYPIENEDSERYKTEFKEGYDKLYDTYGRDMEKLQPELEKFEIELGSRYSTIEEWDFISSLDDFKSRIEKYGNIMISTHRDTGELIYVILDMGI